MNAEVFTKTGLKNTRQRKAVLAVLEEHDGFLTAEQIYDRMHKVEKVSLSTVYRILTVFFENGIVSKSVRSDGIAYFGLKNDEHKHLLVCMSCKEAVEIHTCPLDELGQALGRETGYKITGHSLEFTGICSKCMKNQKRDSK